MTGTILNKFRAYMIILSVILSIAFLPAFAFAEETDSTGETQDIHATDASDLTDSSDQEAATEEAANPTESSDEEEPVQTIVTLDKAGQSETLYVDTTTQLKVTVENGDASATKWILSNPSIASVTDKGLVTARKAGKTKIAAENNSIQSGEFTLVVKKPVLSKTSAKVYNSTSLKLQMLGGKGKIKWSTSNKKIATVSSSGKVKAKKGGKCTIIAKRGKYTAKCKITVPKNYARYKVPDFGAIYGKSGKYNYDFSMNIMKYKASKSYVKKYHKLLKKKGFKVISKSMGMYKYVYIYKNAQNDIVSCEYHKHYVYVIYGNLYEDADI